MTSTGSTLSRGMRRPNRFPESVGMRLTIRSAIDDRVERDDDGGDRAIGENDPLAGRTAAGSAPPRPAPARRRRSRGSSPAAAPRQASAALKRASRSPVQIAKTSAQIQPNDESSSSRQTKMKSAGATPKLTKSASESSCSPKRDVARK